MKAEGRRPPLFLWDCFRSNILLNHLGCSLMRYFLFLLLLSLVGCDGPYNLVEQEYFAQIDSEIEQHAQAKLIDQVVGSNALEPRAFSHRRESLVEVSSEETALASLWGPLLRKADRPAAKVTTQKVDFTASDTSEAIDLVCPRLDSEMLRGKENRLRGIRPDSQIAGDVLLSVLNQGRNLEEHPVALHWWNETALGSPLNLNNMHRVEFVEAEELSQ